MKVLSSCPLGSQNIKNMVFRFELFYVHLPLLVSSVGDPCVFHARGIFYDLFVSDTMGKPRSIENKDTKSEIISPYVYVLC